MQLFELRKSSEFNITAELHIRTNLTGRDYKIIAIHPNRTVVLTSDYDIHENLLKQRSKLQLAPTIWFAYNFNLQNLSRANNDSQVFSVDLSYPRRNLSAEGWYSVTDNIFDSDLALKWSKRTIYDDSDAEVAPGVLNAALLWRNEPLVGNDKDNQTVLFTLRHPTFTKDITVAGNLYRNPIDLIKAKLQIEYCDEPDQLLSLGAGIRDSSSLVGYRNYSYEVYGKHEISEFDLDVR